jgi:hypothetical protein
MPIASAITSRQASTVIWVRLLERQDTRRSSPVATTNGLVQFPEGGYSHLRARLISSAGTETVLPSTRQSTVLDAQLNAPRIC